jgi:hypothetical protein
MRRQKFKKSSAVGVARKGGKFKTGEGGRENEIYGETTY